MTVTEPCVSLTTGTLSPDLRVNYAYGMVLGLDEFLQEQLHRLEKDYLHERSLHGYGTVSGLAVTTAPAEGGSDFVVTVSQGIAIDQWGREIVIRCDQCTRLGAWLAAQELAAPGTLLDHLGPSGEVTVYVVAAYSDCLDAMVPLPGQPCSSSEQTRVASRLRDTWDVELRWERPPMLRWDTDRRLARLLRDVLVVQGLAATDSDEAEIIAAVLALTAEAANGPSDLTPEGGSPSGAPVWRLPADQAADALDRILTVWVTKVRPTINEANEISQPPEQDLIAPNPASDPSILLSSITFTPASPFTPQTPVITWSAEPDDEGRPYLLHTQLIQDLHRLGDAAAPSRELVTLVTSVPDNVPAVIDAWFHLDRPVALPEEITVVDENGVSTQFGASATGPDGNPAVFAERWQLTAQGDTFIPSEGLQLAARFPGDTVFVGDPGTTLQRLQVHEGVVLLDAEPTGDVVAFTTFRFPPPPPEPPLELVTLVATAPDNAPIVIDAWFHLGRPVGLPQEIVVVDEEGVSTKFATAAVNPVGNPAGFSQQWQLTAQDDLIVRRDGLQLGARFPGETVFIGDPGTTLQQVQLSEAVLLLDSGFNGDVVAYAALRLPAPPSTTKPSPPSVEFVTIVGAVFEEKRIRYELWFHLEPRGVRDDRFAAEPAVRLIDESTGNELPIIEFSGPSPLSRNVWRLGVEAPQPGAGLPAYVRFVFPADKFTVQDDALGTAPLLTFIQKFRLPFIGWNPDDSTVVAFCRTDPPQALTDPGGNLGPFPSPLKETTATKTAAASKSAARKAAGRAAAKAAPARAAKAAPAKRSSTPRAPGRGGNQ
ncbi:MAG TPA: hypothetical protein VIJ15_06220 [Dermatophilaceae bacterium]